MSFEILETRQIRGATECVAVTFQAQSVSPKIGHDAKRQLLEALPSKAMQEIVAEIIDEALYLGDWRKGEIQITGIHRIITNPFWSEVEYSVLFPPKRGDIPFETTYRVVRMKGGRQPGACALCVTSEEKVVVLRCFRHTARRWCLEIPRGIQAEGESLEQCARREAEQECGVVLGEQFEVIELGTIEPDTGALMSSIPIFLFTNCQIVTEKMNRGSSESVLEPVLLSAHELRQEILAGNIKDAFLLAALAKAQVAGRWNW